MLAKPSKTYSFGLVGMSLQKTKAFRAIVFDLARFPSQPFRLQKQLWSHIE